MQRRRGLWRSFRRPAVGELLALLALAACAGCADSEMPSAAKSVFVSERREYAPVAASTPPADAPPSRLASPTPASLEFTKSAAEVPPAADRKIIYNAQVTLIVQSLGDFDEQFARLVRESGGYVSQTDQSSQTDAQRTGSWTVRVPVVRFDGFLAAVSRLGELQRSHLDSQDVTMEYYDLEARIGNKQQEEKRLQKHLAESTGHLQDILAVEKELTRVRGEIEQMQGRIRYLGNLSALSTVTLSVTEIHNYKPPVRPTFAGQIARTFQQSLERLIEFGKAVVLFAVALAPWLPVLIVLALVILWVRKRLFRRRPPVVLTRDGP